MRYNLAMAFNRQLAEARLALDFVLSDQMPSLTWDALESGLDGPAIRRRAAWEHPTVFEVMEILPKAMEEMQLVRLSVDRAARRLADHRAREILRTGEDPPRSTREFELMWIRAGYPVEAQEFGTLDDDLSVARLSGRTEQEIRQWLIERLNELTSRAS
jgi:hypothetical protein